MRLRIHRGAKEIGGSCVELEAQGCSVLLEPELEERIFEHLAASSGLVLAAFSPQNMDRFVTIFRATRRAGRTYIADIYLAHLLDQLNMPSLPRAAKDAFRF